MNLILLFILLLSLGCATAPQNSLSVFQAGLTSASVKPDSTKIRDESSSSIIYSDAESKIRKHPSKTSAASPSKNSKRKIGSEEDSSTTESIQGEKQKTVPVQILVQYDQIFQRTREIIRANNSRNLRFGSKSINESQLIQYLQKNPDKLSEDQESLLQIVKEESQTQTDPTKHLRLIPPQGMPGYSDIKFYASHSYYRGKEVVPSSNLVLIWNEFLKQAERKLMLNVFDFDLQEIATTLVAKSNSGVSVTVGIDDDTIKDRPEVKEIYDYLLRNGVNVVAVDSVNLNHQKMAILDWDQPTTAQVLLSSGNLTQSCLGPEGDLKDIPASRRPKRSIPNANHVITMKSWLAANLIANELTKTLDPEFRFKGAQYPTMGSYQITGPGVDPQTLEAYPENSMIISFSPGGGGGNINRNIISHFIRHSDGPIRMIQFAFSSEEVTQALLEKAEEKKAEFDFLSVGDTPFALEDWSQFLEISGVAKYQLAKKKYRFVEIENPRFASVLGRDSFEKLRNRVRIAPPQYSVGKIKVSGKLYSVNAKIHHKVLSAGPYAILGTSFNFSDNAQKNNEQIVVFKNRELVDIVHGMTKWLAESSERSVYEDAMRRNNLTNKRSPRTKKKSNHDNELEVQENETDDDYDKDESRQIR